MSTPSPISLVVSVDVKHHVYLVCLRVKKEQNPMHVKDPVIHTGSVWWIVETRN